MPSSLSLDAAGDDDGLLSNSRTCLNLLPLPDLAENFAADLLSFAIASVMTPCDVDRIVTEKPAARLAGSPRTGDRCAGRASTRA